MQISRRSCIYGAGVTSLSFLLSDECICLLLVCKQLSLNEKLDWQKMLAISRLCAGKWM